MDVSWQDVDISVPNKGKRVPGKYAHLIKNCSRKARKGKLMAIMGPSGSGKTTMLKALVGRIPSGSKTKGVILGDGKERDVNEWMTKSGYVDQDDNIFESLTVYDTIMYAAKFRMVNQNRIKEKVQNILKDLQIENIAYNKMNSISGGERKRTMIAVELVSDPDLIFLDEPTSGLDTYITISFVKLLKEYAIKSGKTIIITIHQPPQEAFRCFDDLLLLAKGKTIYCGEANKCEKFFKSYGFVRNKASPFSDFVLEVLVKEKIENNAIQEMIKQNSLKYDNGQLLTYKQKTRNDMVFDFRFNLKHILLLTRRRFSVYNLTMGKVIFLLLKLLVIGLSIYILHDQTDKYDKNGKNEYSALFSLILIYNLYILFYFAFITISCSGAIFSILPEYKVIKREIGVQSYSMLSYFCSIYIFEFIEQFPFVLIYIIATYVLLKKFLSFLTIFISFGIFVIVLPSFILLGSITRNSKLLYFLIAIPLMFAFSYTIPFHTVIEDPDFKKLPKSVFNLIVGINGIWPLSLFIHLFLYIMIKFFTIERLLDIVSTEKKERIIKSTLEYVYKTMPPVRMPIVTYICYSILMILVYILLCIFLIEIMLQPAMRMKFSNKK